MMRMVFLFFFFPPPLTRGYGWLLKWFWNIVGVGDYKHVWSQYRRTVSVVIAAAVGSWPLPSCKISTLCCVCRRNEYSFPVTAYLSYWQLVIPLESCLQVFSFQNTDCFCSSKVKSTGEKGRLQLLYWFQSADSLRIQFAIHFPL